MTIDGVLLFGSSKSQGNTMWTCSCGHSLEGFGKRGGGGGEEVTTARSSSWPNSRVITNREAFMYV